MADPGNILFYDLKTVTGDVACSDHECDSKRCRETVGCQKLQRRHSHHPCDKEYLGPQSDEMSSCQYDKNSPSVEFLLKEREFLA